MNLDAHVLHGYRLSDLNDLARAVVISNRHRLPTYDWPSCIEIAWSGIAEKLLEGEECPSPNKLFAAGYLALQRELRQATKDDPKRGGPHFWRFWYQTVHGPEDDVVENLTLRTIWNDKLTWRERQAFTCLALAGGDMGLAAEMIGVTKRGLEGRLYRARQSFRYWWHEHETPRPMSHKAVRRPGAGFAARAA